jgi:membrane protein implicated in regulation of membrane protease activity
MIDMFVSLGSWNWLIAAAILFLIEVLAPGIFMLWLGLAALLVGLISLVVVLPAAWQGALFVIFAAAAFPFWKRYRGISAKPTDQPHLNRRADALVGRQFVLETAIANGAGTIRVDDTVWRVTGPDLPAGSRVAVQRADGVMLYVGAAG